MRCKACGKIIDDTSRFCTYCDHDNYPELNQVKTKGTMSDAFESKQVRMNTAASPQNQNAKKNPEKAGGVGCVFVFFFIAFIIFLIMIFKDML